MNPNQTWLCLFDVVLEASLEVIIILQSFFKLQRDQRAIIGWYSLGEPFWVFWNWVPEHSFVNSYCCCCFFFFWLLFLILYPLLDFIYSSKCRKEKEPQPDVAFFNPKFLISVAASRGLPLTAPRYVGAMCHLHEVHSVAQWPQQPLSS